MSVQPISEFPLVSSINVNDVVLGNRSLVTSRIPVSTLTQFICATFLRSGSFVFVPAGATAGQLIAYDGTGWTTSSNVSNIIIGGSTTPRAALDVIGGVRALQGAPTVGNTSNFGYAFEGDGDTGMFSVPPPGGDSNGSISFFLNQTETMRLAAGGNVGIGVTNPEDKLHVSGGIIASLIKTNDPSAIFEIIGGTSKATSKAAISVKGIGEIDLSTGDVLQTRMNVNKAGIVTFYNLVSGTTGTFSGSVTASTFIGNLRGTTATLSQSVSAPALSGFFYGNIRGATGVFSTSVTAPTFFGNLQGTTATLSQSVSAPALSGSFFGNIQGATGGFSTSVTAPIFLGNLEGTTATLSQSVSAPALSGFFYGSIRGATGNFATSVTAPIFLGNLEGTTATLSQSVSAPALSGFFYGSIRGATGVFSTSVTAPTFFGNLQGATGVFSTSVTAPIFFGNIQGTTATLSQSVSAPALSGSFFGNIQGATGGFSTSVTAPTFFGDIEGDSGIFNDSVTAAVFTGAFNGDGSGLTNLKNFPFAPIKTVSTFTGGSYNLTSTVVGAVPADINLILLISNGTANVSIVIREEATYAAPIGTQLILIQQGTGNVSIAPAAGGTVTLSSVTSKRRIYGQHAAVVLIKIGTNNWILGGDIKT